VAASQGGLNSKDRSTVTKVTKCAEPSRDCDGSAVRTAIV